MRRPTSNILGFAVLALSALMLVSSASADVGGTIVAGGSPVTVSITNSGDNAQITFTGTANQRVSLNLTNVSIPLSFVSIVRPDGSNQVSPTFVGVTGKFIDVTTLPSNGTYTIFVDPQSTYTGNITLSLYDVPPDAAGSTAVDTLEPTTLATTVPGQESRLSFAGLSGQQIYVMRSDVTTPTSTVEVIGPDGSVVSSSGLVSSADGDQGAVLPSDGNYTVLVDGFDAAVGQMSLDVSSEEEMPGIFLSDQTADTGSDEPAETPVSPIPMTPLGSAAPGTYQTEFWDTESTEVPGGLQVVNSTSPGTAAVTGTALDEDAARGPVANATVTMTDGAGSATTTTSDAQGGFAFMNMPPGTYMLTISAPPLGLYQVINDAYEADTNSELTAFMGQAPVTIDESQRPEDPAAGPPPTPRAYPSFSRIPATISVLDVKPSASTCAPTISYSAAHTTTYSWKYYVLHVAQNEVAIEKYNASAFKAFAVAVSNYAWYTKIYPASGMPIGADIDNSTNYQCFRPGRITDKRWVGWINEALRYRVVTPANRPPAIYYTAYRAGSNGSPTCGNPHSGVTSTQLSQDGLKYYSEHCSYSDWKDLLGVFYPNSATTLIAVPVRPITSFTSFSDGLRFTFQSSVRNPSTLIPYNVAWGYLLSRKVGNGPWRTIFFSKWDERTRSIQSTYVFNTTGCARYRAAAWNPRLWDPNDSRKSNWTKVNRDNPIGPTGAQC